MNHRVLGTLGVLASPLLLVSLAMTDFLPAPPTRLTAVLGLVFVLGWASSAIGLWALGAAGRGRTGTRLLAVQLSGLALAAAQQCQDFLFAPAPPQTTFYRLCDVAWPASVLFMLVVGTAIAAAGVLRGWRRWAPLACGLTLPLTLAVLALGARPVAGVLFGAGTCAAWALVGLAVRAPGASVLPRATPLGGGTTAPIAAAPTAPTAPAR